jgi:hypothetical protein
LPHYHLTSHRYLVHIEARERASHASIPAAFSPNGIAQVERGIDDLLDPDEHHDDCDKTNGVAVRLRNTIIHSISRFFVEFVPAVAAFSNWLASNSGLVTGLSQV